MCSLWIEQRIDEERDTGKSLREIGRIIAAEVERHFEVKVNPETIKSRAIRSGGSNEPPEENDKESTTYSNLEKT